MSSSQINRWSPQTRKKLVRAGWYPGRSVWEQLPKPEGVIAFPAAINVLSEFGNLQFDRPDAEIMIRFSDSSERRALRNSFASILGHRLYPVGVDNGGDTADIVLDEAGRVFLMFLDLEPLASTFDRALECLLSGRINEPDQIRDRAEAGMFRISYQDLRLDR